jgi:peptidoglycan hydrolase-like protein with peptidoglycan-binding domain
MIWGDLIRLFLLGSLFGGGSSAPSGPAVPAGPFPSAKPDDLPPWPGGWCPDLPPPPEVVSRAWALLPTLWAKGEGTRTIEMTGGRWITYVAATVDGQKSVAAYRAVDCEPAAPAVPPVGPAPSPAAPTTDPGLVGSAITMNEALKLRGYKKADMVLYQDFQKRAGLRVDGYPGAVTMLKLESVLKPAGQTIAPVKVYPWKAGGAYDGVNAPTATEWEGGQVPASSPIAPPPAPPPAPGAPPAQPAVYTPPGPPPMVPAVTPTALTATWSVNTNKDVQHALNAIGYGPLAEDGIIGPQSKAATTAYQREHPPLAQDGIPGPQTKSALTSSIRANEHRAPGVVQPPAVPAVAPGGPTIASNTDVQHALNLLGYKGSNGSPLTEDGKIGPQSQYAIRAFQKEHPPLAQDGIAGPQTKSALSAALGRLSQAA